MGGFWKNRTPGERRMLILCLLVALVCIPLLLAPSGGSNKKLLSARDARQQYESATREIAVKQADMTRLKPEIAQLTYTEAPETVIPKVIKSLQTTANGAGIHIREIKPLRIRRLTGVTKVPLSVRFSCEFAKTVPFLYNTEDPALKLVIDRLNVTAPDTKSRIVDVEAHVSFFTTNTSSAVTDTGAGGA